MSVNKQANSSGSGNPDVTAQRPLSAHEEDALRAGKSRWLPRVFQSYGTPIPELMASPLKTGLIFGAPIGILGAGLGSALGGKNNAGMGALLGGLGAGGLAALAAGADRAAKNEGLEELMRRMPEGASKRDLLADPQYQSDFLGWDNNKIVATARARYYRPTERFSKRTFDMADARERYNERHKSSSIHKDISMSQSDKQVAHAILNNTTLTLAEKMAAYKNLLEKKAEGDLPAPAPLQRAPFDMSTVGQPVTSVPPIPFDPPAAGAGASAPAPSMPVNVPPPSLVTSGGSAPAGAPPAASAPTDNQPSTLEVLKQLMGVGARRSTLYDETAKRLSQLNKARLSAGNWLGENALYPAAKGVSNAAGAVGDMFKQEVKNPTLLDNLKPYAPHLAVAGGGLGALALAHYLSQSKKKKRHEHDADSDEYSMPKAANMNWYALARERQKRSNALIPIGAAALRPVATAAASRIPSWLAPAGGTAAGIGGLYGLSKLLGGGKDPSLLQQIMQSKYTPYAAAGLGTAGLLGGAAYMGSQSGKNEVKKKKKPAGEKKADLLSAGMGGAMGAGLGGAAGALYGALAPGHEEDPETGRRRRRSRLMAALRGLAGGAVTGGLGGAALGHFAPNIPHGAMDAIGMGKQLELPPPPSASQNMQTNVAQMSPAKRKLYEALAPRNKLKAPPTPDPIEVAKAEAMSQGLGEEPGDTGLGPNAAMQAQMTQQ